MTRLLVLLLVLHAPAFARAQAATPEPSSARSDWLRLGRAALAAGHYEEAASDLANASGATTTDEGAAPLADAWAELADGFVLRGESDRAVAAYGAALLLVPTDATLHVARGWAFDRSRDSTRARDDVAIARRLAPGSAEASVLERHLDQDASLRLALFVTGGVALGAGALTAIGAALAGSLNRAVVADQTPYDALIVSGAALAVLGIATILLGEGLHLGSTELPRRAVVPVASWLPGGGFAGLRARF